MATRAPFYFKLHREVSMISSWEATMQFVISGNIMRRRSAWLPNFFDEPVGYLSRTYEDAKQYSPELLALEQEALKACEGLIADKSEIDSMIANHNANLKKLNIGYQLICWFQGLGDEK